MTQPPPAPRKFMFDTVFEGGRVIEAPRARRHYTAEEVEHSRAEGFAEGERSALVQAESAAAASLAEIAGGLRQALSLIHI